MNITRSSRVWLRIKRHGRCTSRDIADEMEVPLRSIAYVMLDLYRNGCVSRTQTTPFEYEVHGWCQIPGSVRVEEVMQ